MTFILWRQDSGGAEVYVTGWSAQGGQAAYSNNRGDALRYETRAAAEAAVARSRHAGWQVREVA